MNFLLSILASRVSNMRVTCWFSDRSLSWLTPTIKTMPYMYCWTAFTTKLHKPSLPKIKSPKPLWIQFWNFLMTPFKLTKHKLFLFLPVIPADRRDRPSDRFYRLWAVVSRERRAGAGVVAPAPSATRPPVGLRPASPAAAVVPAGDPAEAAEARAAPTKPQACRRTRP